MNKFLEISGLDSPTIRYSALDPVAVPEPWPAALMAPLLLAGWISLSRRKTYP
jgi:hypothetical protein